MTMGSNVKSATRSGAHEAIPLRTVTALTGLSADLVRAWENRYGVVRPVRGPRGARLYSSADVDHLRTLARVVAAGRAIGDVARLRPHELERLAASGPAGPRLEPATAPGSEAMRDDILRCLQSFDVVGVSRRLGDAVVALGLRRALQEMILPLVQEVGARWQAGTLSIAEEHVLIGVLRELLASLMRSRVAAGPPIVLAAPAGEQHDIGLLLVALMARDLGVPVVYLGTDLPAREIVDTVERTCARALGLAVVFDDNRVQAVREVRTIQKRLPQQTRLWLGGADAPHVAGALKPFRGVVLGSLDAAEAALQRLAPPAVTHS